MKRQYHKWYSPNLGREMELLVFGHGGARVLVFPTRMQRFYEFENRRAVGALASTIRSGNIQLFCIDSLDQETFYALERHPRERIDLHLAYERYILHEVLPLSERLNPNSPLISHGSSLGAYHAAAIAMRHPWRFHRLVAFSGRYDLTRHYDDFEDLFRGYYDHDLYYLMPSHFLPNLHDSHLLAGLQRMEITLVIGEEDPFRGSNEELSAMLHQKGVKHDFHYWGGRAHRWRVWRDMLPRFL